MLHAGEHYSRKLHSKFHLFLLFFHLYFIHFFLFAVFFSCYLGNRRAIEQHDLYELSYNDSSIGVYNQFSIYWNKQLKKSKKYNRNDKKTNSKTDDSNINSDKKNVLEKNVIPSLSIALLSAFGGPFMGAGSLKLVHDSLIFVGPLALNKLIFILNDPEQPLSLGLYYVAAIFFANFLMSICLRQYFWCVYLFHKMLLSFFLFFLSSIYISSSYRCY